MRLLSVILFILLLLVSCGQQTTEKDAKTELITLLSQDVDTYSATYEKTSSTAGSGTTQKITVEVNNGQVSSYEKNSVGYGAGRGANCTTAYTAADESFSCTCQGLFPSQYLDNDEARLVYELENGPVEATYTCETTNMTTILEPMDKQLKTAALQWFEKNDYNVTSFTLTDGRSCYLMQSSNLWCFREDSLMVTSVISLTFHPVTTTLLEYPFEPDGEAREKVDSILGFSHEEDIEEQLTEAELQEQFAMELDRLGGNLEELPYGVDDVREVLEENKEKMSDADYQRLLQETNTLDDAVAAQNEEYDKKLEHVGDILDTGDYETAQTEFLSFEESGYVYYDAIEQKVLEIKVEIAKAIGLT